MVGVALGALSGGAAVRRPLGVGDVPHHHALFIWSLVLALRMRGIGEPAPEPIRPTLAEAGPPAGCSSDLLWGLIALSNSSLLLFLPVCGIWISLGAPRTKWASPPSRRAALAALLFFAVIVPWIYRNWTVFHAFIPMRSNLGAEIYAGSGPGSNGFPFVATLPLVERDPETMPYKSLGEIAWVREQGAKAKAYIAAHRAHYALITLKRIYFYWVSVPHPDERSPWGEFFRELNYCFLSITGCLGLASVAEKPHPAAWLFAWAFLFFCRSPIIL